MLSLPSCLPILSGKSNSPPRAFAATFLGISMLEPERAGQVLYGGYDRRIPRPSAVGFCFRARQAPSRRCCFGPGRSCIARGRTWRGPESEPTGSSWWFRGESISRRLASATLWAALPRGDLRQAPLGIQRYSEDREWRGRWGMERGE
jgi:hypothetical protein